MEKKVQEYNVFYRFCEGLSGEEIWRVLAVGGQSIEIPRIGRNVLWRIALVLETL